MCNSEHLLIVSTFIWKYFENDIYSRNVLNRKYNMCMCVCAVLWISSQRLKIYWIHAAIQFNSCLINSFFLVSFSGIGLVFCIISFSGSVLCAYNWKSNIIHILTFHWKAFIIQHVNKHLPEYCVVKVLRFSDSRTLQPSYFYETGK